MGLSDLGREFSDTFWAVEALSAKTACPKHKAGWRILFLTILGGEAGLVSAKQTREPRGRGGFPLEKTDLGR